MSGLTAAIRNIKKAETLLVTPKVIEFLRRVPDGVIWDEAGYQLWREITQRAMGNEDRSGRFGASSRGTCLRRQIFVYLGMPTGLMLEVETQNLFNDGKWRHLRWQMMGVQSGALTHAEWPAKMPKYRITTSIDGVHTDKHFLFELKGDRNWTRIMGGVPDAHDLQMHTMMLVTGWDTFAYIIEDKSSQQWREIIVHRDPKIIRIVVQEMEELNTYVEDRKLPPVLSSCAAKVGQCSGCPFQRNCYERSTHGDRWPDRPGDWDS